MEISEIEKEYQKTLDEIAEITGLDKKTIEKTIYSSTSMEDVLKKASEMTKNE